MRRILESRWAFFVFTCSCAIIGAIAWPGWRYPAGVIAGWLLLEWRAREREQKADNLSEKCEECDGTGAVKA